MAPLPPPPKEIDSRAASLMREAIAGAPFDGSVFRVLGMAGLAGWRSAMRTALPRLPTAACAALSKFFIINDPVPQDELAAALGGPEVLAALESAALAVRTPEGHFRCLFNMAPAAGVLAFSDPIDDPATESPPDDFIMPVSGSSRFVDDLAVREPCELAIDLGCGQGYLAIRSLTHARRCIASDINARAIAFARTNASLAGAGERIECRQGSFFEPLRDVAGRVGLLTCNPPFIMLPGGHTTASVTQMEGDGMLEHLVRGVPEMLSTGGWATLIGLWENADQQDWVSRIRGWLEGAGCDALVLQFRTYRPEEYLQQWFPPEVRAGAEQGWRALCERRRIGAITFGGIIVRKRLATNWLRSMFTLINVRSGPASDQLRAYFATQTALQSIPSPEALLDRRLRIAPGWRFDPAIRAPGAAPPGLPLGLALPVARAAEFEPLLQTFQSPAPARQTLQHLHAWGRLAQPPEHPSITRMLHDLVSGGCLDIVE